MSFLQPLLLWGLLAAAIPIIIHLLNRRRHKTVMWAAMQFLLKATRESRGKKKLRHILILTCRCLGIAALATAAARPLLSGMMGWNGGKPDLVVLILDRSASMEATPKNGNLPRRKLALQRVRDAMADLDGTRLVLIDSASGTAQDVPSPDVLDQLSSTAATDTAADLSALASRASEYLAASPGRAEVWIASDLQASNWQTQNDRWTSARAALAALPQPPKLRILALSGKPSANQGIRILSSRRSDSELILDLEISRDQDTNIALDLPLTATLNGIRSTSNLSIVGQNLRFRKTLPIPPSGNSGHGWLSIPGDGNPRDNVAFFAYGPPRPVKSLVVAAPGEAANYLAIAAAPDGFAGQSVERLDPHQIPGLETENLSAILWAAPLPSGAIAESLTRFLSAGGEILFFPPPADNDTKFLDLQWSPVTESDRGKFLILDSWDRDDGLLRDGIDGSPIPADRLKAVKRRLPKGESTPLARWDDSAPFLIRRIVDRGTAWFVGSLPDYTWSNLGDADVLLPLVQRAVTEGAARFDDDHFAALGSREAAPRPGETNTRLDDYGTPHPGNTAFEAGIHRLGDRTLALNRPPAEDAPEILSREELGKLLEGTGFTLLEDRGTSATDKISRDAWRGFLIAMLCFLIAEAALCLPKKPATIPSALSTHTGKS
ncbi:MAG: hypothetical protein EAZ84_09735 [Verrucomicrobia bacterium]|nr:MAG: hypothetical protein EAZ84_09735 [Verrucomicrobiota bacterium]TAE86726.1 MAG: hypothetical protein EAZ82_10070 [Verrucomicrobiota bacterium]TAF24516.1 MAG: hypothetical protein EAZ71_10410 [Verrucomicrobiota bacterium]